jgi:hypothetical protein
MTLEEQLERAVAMERDAALRLPVVHPAKGGALQGVEDAIMEQALIRLEMESR